MRYWPFVLAFLAVGAGAMALFERQTAPVDRPRLAFLTSLPLLFGEDFALDTPRLASIARIEQDYSIVPISIADAASLEGQSLLLMAHPRAQPAEVLVELDTWVRKGGRIVLLADPALKWESSRALGDRTRPPPDFADTGLLHHWGLRMTVDETREGSLQAADKRCTVREGGLVARCRVGRGRASIIADADFVMDVGENARRRLDLMMAELSRADLR